MNQELTSIHLINKISELLKNARNKVINTVNQTMVLTYYEIGRMIVEDEQQGQYRAEYGERIIRELSKSLTKEFGRGFSFTNLNQMRQFYIVYSESQTLSDQIVQTVSEQLQISENKQFGIYETVSRKLDEPKSSTVLTKSLSIPQTLSAELQTPHFQLSWSHYLKLMRMTDENERRFYEIEAFNNNWSLRELQRQYDSALYTRLALSKDKQQILELSTKGQIIWSTKTKQ
jgi:hypothetical protein